jgi:hypothetical protein
MIRAATTREDLAELMGGGRQSFLSSMFGLSIGPDDKAPDRYAVFVRQGGLGLNREYYIMPRLAEKKTAYLAYMTQMLGMIGWVAPEQSAAAILDFETAIADVSWSNAERRDPDKTYNPMSVAALAEAAPFPWRTLAGGLLGIETAARSAPDGYTALITSDAIVSTPHIVTFNVDYVRTLTPISQLARSPQTISVHPSLGVTSVGELIELAKRRPGLGGAMYAQEERGRYRCRSNAPPLEMRVMTKERRVGVELADDLPNYSGHSGKFMLKLIAAWIAMGFRRPEVTLGKTVHRAQ